MIHPNYKTLVNYIENKLIEADRIKVDEHLSHPCPQCKSKLAQLHAVLEAVATDKTVAPPADVLSRAIDLHRKPAKATHPILRVLATLQFDNRIQMSAMASRGVSRAHQLLYTTKQLDIDLKITPEHSQHTLVGQILGSEQTDEISTAFVSLQNKTGKPLMGTETGSLGQFAFRQIPSGIYDLVFDLGSQEVAINSLEFIND
jgi:hypothetical protein